ncbi:MAG: dethiobiotin synthase [Alphaproteobacteria bacterium]|uniref:ATP-dependent dethiobiotin synthetase BioD n=1 Tax=Candidatus Nitrobium versatile TaxID=2884831 RepID=A0A953LVU4_9BACT|nr:dethiobiotin synthase [Candidatus Nitrobium versatile]
MKGVFVTGTDTGVGKTMVSAALICGVKRGGRRVGAMKPVETGCPARGGMLLPADGAFLREMAGTDDPLELIAPSRFALPLAPMVAAEQEGTSVDLDAVMSAYRILREKYDFLVVEGAGGLLVPLRDDAASRRPSPYFVCDLIKEMGLPAVVVARPSLGTINHTLLTVGHALGKGIPVLGIIINHSAPPGDTIAERTNPDVLRRLSPVPVLGIFPHTASRSPETITEAAARFLDFSRF